MPLGHLIMLGLRLEEHSNLEKLGSLRPEVFRRSCTHPVLSWITSQRPTFILLSYFQFRDCHFHFLSKNTC